MRRAVSAYTGGFRKNGLMFHGNPFFHRFNKRRQIDNAEKNTPVRKTEDAFPDQSELFSVQATIHQQNKKGRQHTRNLVDQYSGENSRQ